MPCQFPKEVIPRVCFTIGKGSQRIRRQQQKLYTYNQKIRRFRNFNPLARNYAESVMIASRQFGASLLLQRKAAKLKRASNYSCRRHRVIKCSPFLSFFFFLSSSVSNFRDCAVRPLLRHYFVQKNGRRLPVFVVV